MGDNSTTIPSSDEIHNRNCHRYLLQLKPLINDTITDLLPDAKKLNELLTVQYNNRVAYGDLYSLCISKIELFLEQDLSLSDVQNQALDALIHSIYHNNNHIIDEATWINDIVSQKRPQEINAGRQIAEKLKDPKQRINLISPKESGSIVQSMLSVLSSRFKPQFETNIPTIKYDGNFIEYRFSTQAQRDHGIPRVSPLFIRWLKINADKCAPEQLINHIYFNNMGFDRESWDMAGSKEKELTKALHQLEVNLKFKVLVITLPSHKGLMATDCYKNTEELQKYADVFDELLNVALGNPHKSGVSDFLISKAARDLLFKDEPEKTILEALLNKSFKAQGLAEQRHISTAQKQAIWVHFIKYDLTNYIINTIKPTSYNFSCKDSIDRGAVSSTYYNLMKSLAVQAPMKRDEFERSLDAAAASVKGRGMNFHRKIIWNALNTYINANHEALISNEAASWLIYWRDMNCPTSCIEKLLKIRIDQSENQFKSLQAANQLTVQVNGLSLLREISRHNEHLVSGKKLLLEAVSHTSELLALKSPSKEFVKKYNNLANELRVNHPVLMVIGGLMEVLLGCLLYIPSFGYSQKMIKHGLATSNAGFFSEQRYKISDKMCKFSFKELNPSEPQP